MFPPRSSNLPVEPIMAGVSWRACMAGRVHLLLFGGSAGNLICAIRTSAAANPRFSFPSLTNYSLLVIQVSALCSTSVITLSLPNAQPVRSLNYPSANPFYSFQVNSQHNQHALLNRRHCHHGRCCHCPPRRPGCWWIRRHVSGPRWSNLRSHQRPCCCLRPPEQRSCGPRDHPSSGCPSCAHHPGLAN